MCHVLLVICIPRTSSKPQWCVLCVLSGAVQTLMSVDADRVVNLCVSLHELWSLPAQIAIALYLLYTQVSPSTAQLTVLRCSAF